MEYLISREVAMTDIFIKKDAWFQFAEEHNSTADVGSVVLNGSDSYTLAACHVAAGIAIPCSVRLDVQRTKGVADHFNGLRSYYELGVASKSWLPSLVTQFRQFARENSLNQDELIKRIIVLTERVGRRGFPKSPSVVGHDPDPSGKEFYVPGRAEFEAAYKRVATAGEAVALVVVLEAIEATAATAGIPLQNDWRETIERQIEMWMGQGESNGKN